MLAMRPSAILLLARAVSASAPPAPHSLRVDRADPELLDDGTPAPLVFGAALSPVLSWQLPTAGRGQRQHAYEIRLSARAPSGVALAWESGRVYDSEQEVRVPLALQHETEYEWQVRVWDAAAGHGHGNSLYALASAPDPVASAWSEPHAFETLVHQDAWAARNASWIGGGNELRGDFTVPTGKTIESARAYVTGLGAFYLYVNGARIGNHIMDPGQTVVTERVLYVTFDLTKILKPGTNAIGGLLGNYKYGYLDIWCNSTAAGETFGHAGGACQSFRLMVVANMSDGSSVTMGTDETWKARNGAITYTHLWHGEIYDARRETQEHWASPPSAALDSQLTVGGAPAGWAPAKLMSPIVGVLSPQLMPPIRVVQSFEPVSVKTIEQHVFEPGCGSGFDGGRFIRCPKCNGSSPKLGAGSGGSLAAAVFFQSCSNELTHVEEAEAYGPKSCVSSGIKLVEPAVLAGWEGRYKGAFACAMLPANTTDSLTVVDFGQNMAGFTTLKIKGAAGTTVTLQHTENLGGATPGVPHNTYYPGDGASMTKNGGKGGTGVDPSGAHVASTCGMTDSRSGGAPGSGWYEHGWFECANQTDSYTLKGGAEEVFTPSFTYHGFRYVAVRGLPSGFTFTKDMLTAHFVHSDLPRVASLTLPKVAATTSTATPDILNEIYHSTLCAQMSQLWSIPTDCPQREKRGWMGDAHMSSSGLMFDHDAQAFHTNFLQNINDDQRKGCQNNPADPFIHPCTGSAVGQAAGAVPDVSPFQTSPYGSNPGSVVWQSAYPVIARNMWRHYGDKAVLRSHWASLNAWMGWLERTSDPKTHLSLNGGLSDWVPPGGNGKGPNTPADECSAFYGLLDTKHMAEMAEALGESADAAKYNSMLAAGRKAYHSHFFNATSQQYSSGSQCSCMMALFIGAVPAELEATVLKTMVDDIQSSKGLGALPKGSKNHINTGIIGTTFMLDTLTQFGRADVGIATILNDSYPSFGHMISQGATTLWEAWEGTRTQQVSSWNHIMFGGNVHTWVYSTLAGIDTAVNGSTGGWERIIFKPAPAAMTTLGSAAATITTRFGNASIDWKLATGGALTMSCTVPAGATAEIHVPQLPQFGKAMLVSEGTKPVWKAGAYVPGAAGVTGASLKDEKPWSEVGTVVVTVGSGDFAIAAKAGSAA